MATPSATDQCLVELLSNGFTRVAAPVQITDTFRRRVDLLLNSARVRPWGAFKEWLAAEPFSPTLFGGPGRDTALYDFLGADAEVDRIIKKVFTTEAVRRLVHAKENGPMTLWQCHIRRAEKGGQALRVHRDRADEVVVALLVDEALTTRGTTAFIPKTHRLPRWLVPPRGLPAPVLRAFLTPARGGVGDVIVFDASTLHGRLALETGERRIAAIISLRPTREVADRRIPASALDVVRPING